MRTPIKGNAEDYKSKKESPMRNPWLNKDFVEEDASDKTEENLTFSGILNAQGLTSCCHKDYKA